MLGWRDIGTPEPAPSNEGLVCGSSCAGNDPYGVVSEGLGRLGWGERAEAISYGESEAGQRKGCCIGSPEQDTVPVCPGVSQELGYLYWSSWPLLGVTQTRHDGQMETCFEDGLMGGWGRGTLPASIPGRLSSPRSLGAAPPGQTPCGVAAETSRPVLGSAQATRLLSPLRHPSVPKPITAAQLGLTDPVQGLA